jgi:two-component system response regulator YesN
MNIIKPSSMNLLPEDQEKIFQIKEHMKKNFKNHITYASLTQQFLISERKLSADFKKEFNQTIYEFITEVRIEKAKELLEKSCRPVKAIAYMVGYHECNLIKQFKKLTGMAPLDWRKQNLNRNIQSVKLPDSLIDLPDSLISLM